MGGGKVHAGMGSGGRVKRCGGRDEVRWGVEEWMWICGEERVEPVVWERLEREVVLLLVLELWGGFLGGTE